MSSDAGSEALPEITADEIAEIRAAHQLSQKDFAAHVGVGRTAVSSWEDGGGITDENHRRLFAAVRALGHVEDGEIVTNAPEIDSRLGEFGPHLSAAVSVLFADVKQELRSMVHGEWYETHTTLTAADLTASNSHPKSKVGRVLTILADEPQPASDGFVVETYLTDRSSRANRWLVRPVGEEAPTTEERSTSDDLPIRLGDDLRLRRRCAGYTTTALAEECNTSQWTITQAETNHRVPKRDATIIALTSALSDVHPVVISDETIAAVREEYQLSQVALAELCDVSESAIGRWERGDSPKARWYGRLVSTFQDQGFITEEGDVAPNTDSDRDDRAREANTRTVVTDDQLQATIDGVRRYLDAKPFAGTLTAGVLTSGVMDDSGLTDQQVGEVLALLAEKPRPGRDGFRLTTNDQGGPSNRYTIERTDQDTAPAAPDAASNADRVSEVSD